MSAALGGLRVGVGVDVIPRRDNPETVAERWCAAVSGGAHVEEGRT
jgi:hypothetical protein